MNSNDVNPVRSTSESAHALTEVERIEQVGQLAADAFRLAALEARVALSSVGSALLLLVVAGVGALVAFVLAIVAGVFTLHAFGLGWPLALALTAAVVLAICLLAARRAGKLAYRLTMPATRSALQPGARP